MHGTSVEVHLRDLVPGQHSSEETLQRWRAVGDGVFGLTCPGIKVGTSRVVNAVFNQLALPTLLTMCLTSWHFLPTSLTLRLTSRHYRIVKDVFNQSVLPATLTMCLTSRHFPRH